MNLKKFVLMLLSITLFHNLSLSSSLVGNPAFNSSSGNAGVLNPLHAYLDRAKGDHIEILHRFRFMSPRRLVNVVHYGAKSDGTDNSKAFEKAWREACSSRTPAIVLVPRRTKYLLKPIIFAGPCNSHVTVAIKGELQAPTNRSEWKVNNARHWILFENVNNLTVAGGGRLNGNGKIWWQKSCKINRNLPCVDAPTALAFYGCNSLRVTNLKIRDSQQIHMLYEKCSYVEVSLLDIEAPEESPNTDGIHIATTKNMEITRSSIRTGDDCISIVSGSRNVRIAGLDCGPRHGISIGSLGANNSEGHVSDIIVDRALLNGTTNGVRIKTWQGGYGYVSNIIFQIVLMHSVQNPIIIDQNYCDSKYPCNEQVSAVKVSEITYRNIRGTSASENTMTLNCSGTFRCRRVVMENIYLVGEGGKLQKNFCQNVDWYKRGVVIPQPCV